MSILYTPDRPNPAYQWAKTWLSIITPLTLAFSLATPASAASSEQVLTDHQNKDRYSFSTFSHVILGKLTKFLIPPTTIRSQEANPLHCDLVQPDKAPQLEYTDYPLVYCTQSINPNTQSPEVTVSIPPQNSSSRDKSTVVEAFIQETPTSGVVVIESYGMDTQAQELIYEKYDQVTLSPDQVRIALVEVEQHTPATIIIDGRVVQIARTTGPVVFRYQIVGNETFVDFGQFGMVRLGELEKQMLIFEGGAKPVDFRTIVIKPNSSLIDQFPLVSAPTATPSATPSLDPIPVDVPPPATEVSNPTNLQDAEPVTPYNLENIPLANVSELILSPSQSTNYEFAYFIQNPQEEHDLEVDAYHDALDAIPFDSGKTDTLLASVTGDVSWIRNTWANLFPGSNIDRPDVISVKGPLPAMSIKRIQIDGNKVIVTGLTRDTNQIVYFKRNRRNFGEFLRNQDTALTAQLIDGSSSPVLRQMIIDLIAKNQYFPQALTVSNEWVTTIATKGETSQVSNAALLSPLVLGYIIHPVTGEAIYTNIESNTHLTITGATCLGGEWYYTGYVNEYNAYLSELAVDHQIIDNYDARIDLLVPLNSAVLEEMSKPTSHHNPLPLAQRRLRSADRLHAVNPRQTPRSLQALHQQRTKELYRRQRI